MPLTEPNMRVLARVCSFVHGIPRYRWLLTAPSSTAFKSPVKAAFIDELDSTSCYFVMGRQTYINKHPLSKTDWRICSLRSFSAPGVINLQSAANLIFDIRHFMAVFYPIQPMLDRIKTL